MEEDDMRGYVRLSGLFVVSVVAIALFSTSAFGSPILTLLTGSTGTVTVGLTSVTFNNDPAAIGGSNFPCPAAGPCNADVATGTNLTLAARALGVGEGIIVSSPLTGASIGTNNFLTFANHANLDYSLTAIDTYSNANCASLAVTQSCVVYPGSAILLTLSTSTSTTASLGLHGRASDTGTGGLAAGSNWQGGFSQKVFVLPDNVTVATPASIQFYFCGTNTVNSIADCLGTGANKSITSSVSGNFFATAVPEPLTLSLVGAGLLGLGVWGRRKQRS